MQKLEMKLSLGIRPQVIVSIIGKSPLVFDITKPINKTEIVDKVDPFGILVRVLEYYKLEEVYFNKLEDIYNSITTMEDKEISKKLSEIVDILPTEMIDRYLTNIDYKSPAYLRDVFTDDIIKNNEGDRERTYIKSDYRDLVILVIKLKLIALAIARYIYIFEININNGSSIKVFRLIDAIKGINSLPAYEKIGDFVRANIGGDDNITEFDISRIMTKNITPRGFPDLTRASIMLFLGLAGSPDDDSGSSSLVSHLSRLCKNKNSISKNIMINNPNMIGDDEDSTQSVADTFVSNSKVPLSVPVSLIYAFGTVEGDPVTGIEKILRQIKYEYDVEDLKVSEAAYDAIYSRTPTNPQNAIMAWLYFDIIEDEYITKYFNREIVTNLRIVGYAVLKKLGLTNLARVLVSGTYDVGVFMTKVNNQPVDKEIEDLVSQILSLGITKKAKGQKFGLSIMEDEIDVNSLKELIITPPVTDISNTRWVDLTDSTGDNVFIVKNAREELLKLMIYSRDNIKRRNA